MLQVHKLWINIIHIVITEDTNGLSQVKNSLLSLHGRNNCHRINYLFIYLFIDRVNPLHRLLTTTGSHRVFIIIGCF